MAQAKKKKWQMPDAFTTLFILTIIVAILTWIVPAGEYEVVDGAYIPGTYTQVASQPQGLWDIFMAPWLGFLGTEITDGAVDVSLFILVLGGFLAIVTETGAIDAGIAALIEKGRDNISAMIWILMLVFALGGSTYGMAEETMAFYPLLIPIMVTVGMDSLVAVGIILGGSGMGVLASTVNPFATGIASDAAGVSMADGMLLRAIMLVVFYVIAAYYVSSYAKKVLEDPKNSLIYDKFDEQKEKFAVEQHPEPLTGTQKTVLFFFGLAFVIMVIALIPWIDLFGENTFFNTFHQSMLNTPVLGDLIGQDSLPFGEWYLIEITMLFFIMSIIIGFIARIPEKKFVAVFLEGMNELLSVAMICAIARGIQVVMNDGMMTATILHWGEVSLAGLSEAVFTVLIFLFYIPMSFLIPSTSGLAAATMGIMGPLGTFAGVGVDIVVTAYQSACGIVNLITPTSGVVMGALAIADIDLSVWLKFMRNLVIIVTVLSIGFLLLGVYVF